jgi:hypothetical protein
MMEVTEFFAGRDESARIFEALRTVVDELGATELRVTKSQIAFRRHKAFAWAWVPGMYLRGDQAPLVLSLSLQRNDSSSRWKEVVEPTPGRFTHHLELTSISDIDDQVRTWLQEAWAGAV